MAHCTLKHLYKIKLVWIELGNRTGLGERAAQDEDIGLPKKGLTLVSNSRVSGRTPLSPFAASPLLGQAPLPTLSTPTRKSSSKKPSATQKMTLLSDNKENLHNSGKKMVLQTETGKKKNTRDTAEDIMLKKLNDTSLRQLRKMFKEKLQIKETTNENNEDMNDVKEVAKMRPALQTLPENRIVAEDETRKEY